MWDLLKTNIFPYDWIILAVGLINIIILIILIIKTWNLNSLLKLNISANEKNPYAVIKKFFDESGKITKIEKLRDKENFWYSLFVNVIAIFPLLGMLGTIIALLKLSSGSENLMQNFYSALTSTFWGMVFAVGFKIIDAFVSAKVEANEKAVSLRLQQFLELEQKEKIKIRKKSESAPELQEVSV
ncbi:MAG: MotA/TolQ/ExbB proton channel family protein [Oscillospiraceae bacterium]|nr:MotA/TolQ/ExbB proton channel family protein [Oscillospiraceae bacterium]